jgi:hypothetical protein
MAGIKVGAQPIAGLAGHSVVLSGQVVDWTGHSVGLSGDIVGPQVPSAVTGHSVDWTGHSVAVCG